MATNVTINGTTYAFPTEGENGWGSVVTNWAIAVSAYLLQRSGGTFTLTAEVDFGATFATKQAYIKSRTANIATAGFGRLARADVVSWRNQGNSANLDLGVDSSNRLTFAGVPIAPSGAIGAANTVYTSDGTAPAWAFIVNANVDAAAAIAYSKLNLSGSIVNADINTAAAIARSKMAAGTNYAVQANNSSGVLGDSTMLYTSGVLSAWTALTSAAATPATSGAIRLGNTETIAWRNAANTTNRTLAVDAGNALVYTGATAGNETVISATNSDDTNANSNARFRALVGGSSGGDPYLDCIVTGVTSWSAGIDNSDSDAFFISQGAPGTNPALRFAVTTQDASFYGNVLLRAAKELRLGDSDSSNYVAHKSAATVGTNYTVTWPASSPADNALFGHATAGTYAWGLVVNANVDAAAAIAYSKLNLSNSIVNADISSSAAIVRSKLAAPVTARYSTTAGQTIASSGTPTIVDFGTQTFDSNSAVTTGAGWAFTAPFTAVYRVSTNVRYAVDTFTAGNTVSAFLYKNGSSVSELCAYYPVSTASQSPELVNSDLVSLTAGDTIDIRTRHGEGSGRSLRTGAGEVWVSIEQT